MSGISHLYRDVFALKPTDQYLFRPTEKDQFSEAKKLPQLLPRIARLASCILT